MSTASNGNFKARIGAIILFIMLFFAIVCIITYCCSLSGNIIGNPNYEDRLYIKKNEFRHTLETLLDKAEIPWVLHDNSPKDNVLVYVIQNSVTLKAGLQSNKKMLSYIICEWNIKTEKDIIIHVCTQLYRIFDKSVAPMVIKNNLIEIGAIKGTIDINTDTYFVPEKPVQFGAEQKGDTMRFYINDAAMGY